MGKGFRHIDVYKNNPEYAHNFRGMDRSPKVNWWKDARHDPLLGANVMQWTCSAGPSMTA